MKIVSSGWTARVICGLVLAIFTASSLSFVQMQLSRDFADHDHEPHHEDNLDIGSSQKVSSHNHRHQHSPSEKPHDHEHSHEPFGHSDIKIARTMDRVTHWPEGKLDLYENNAQPVKFLAGFFTELFRPPIF